jgi:hypothetical protein
MYHHISVQHDFLVVSWSFTIFAEVWDTPTTNTRSKVGEFGSRTTGGGENLDELWPIFESRSEFCNFGKKNADVVQYKFKLLFYSLFYTIYI